MLVFKKNSLTEVSMLLNSVQIFDSVTIIVSNIAKAIFSFVTVRFPRHVLLEFI
jgi:hypothetical protein